MATYMFSAVANATIYVEADTEDAARTKAREVLSMKDTDHEANFPELGRFTSSADPDATLDLVDVNEH